MYRAYYYYCLPWCPKPGYLIRALALAGLVRQRKKEKKSHAYGTYSVSHSPTLEWILIFETTWAGRKEKKKKKNSKIKHDDYKTRTYLWQLLFCFCCCWYCLLCCSHGVPLMRRLRRGKGGGRKKKQEQENSRRHDSFIGQWLCCLFVIVIIIIFFFFLPPPFQLEQFNLPYQPEIEVVEGIHGLSCTSCWQIIYHSTPSSQHTHTKAPSPNYPTQQTVPSWHVVPAWAIAPVAVAVVVVEVVLQM